MDNKKEYLILLDNGHGSNTIGKCSPDKKLKELGYNPHILVPEDNDIPLNTRVKRAN